MKCCCRLMYCIQKAINYKEGYNTSVPKKYVCNNSVPIGKSV